MAKFITFFAFKGYFENRHKQPIKQQLSNQFTNFQEIRMRNATYRGELTHGKRTPIYESIDVDAEMEIESSVKNYNPWAMTLNLLEKPCLNSLYSYTNIG